MSLFCCLKEGCCEVESMDPGGYGVPLPVILTLRANSNRGELESEQPLTPTHGPLLPPAATPAAPPVHRSTDHHSHPPHHQPPSYREKHPHHLARSMSHPDRDERRVDERIDRRTGYNADAPQEPYSHGGWPIGYTSAISGEFSL